MPIWKVVVQFAGLFPVETLQRSQENCRRNGKRHSGRSIYEDAEIFARNLHLIGKMDDRDYTNYVELYRVMMQYLRPPDLLIFLDARIETLVKQIARRGREYEQSIPRSYLEQLSCHYKDWIGGTNSAPCLCSLG